MAAVVFPREFHHAGAARLRLAGRVSDVAAHALVVSDAFAHVVVRPTAPVAARAGDLAIFEGERGPGGALERAVLIELHAGVPCRGEASRLAGGVGAALEARNRAFAATRAFFSDRAYVEVETPSLVPSPGLDLHLDAFRVDASPERYLITSPEYQMKRLVAGGVFRCFQFSRCFRRSEIGASHNPEFTMLEWYRAFADADAMLDETEALVRAVAAELGVRSIRRATSVDLQTPFERITVAQAFERYAGVAGDEAIALASNDEDRFFRLLVERVEPALAAADHGVFLTEYPAPFASLARLSPADPRVAERFELYVAGVELSNGFGELTDAAEQRARLHHDQVQRAERGLPVYPIDERFVGALEEGLPPTAGNALGVDRLIALCVGADRIADVLSFPEGWL